MHILSYHAAPVKKPYENCKFYETARGAREKQNVSRRYCLYYHLIRHVCIVVVTKQVRKDNYNFREEVYI